jgi:hypothetical protein
VVDRLCNADERGVGLEGETGLKLAEGQVKAVGGEERRRGERASEK